MIEERENWPESFEQGRKQAEEIMSTFPKLWLGIREGWKSLGEIGGQLTEGRKNDSLLSMASHANLLRGILVASIKESSRMNQRIGYQFAFENWLANAKRGATSDTDRGLIADLEERQRQIREQYSAIWKSFDQQRSEFALLSQFLSQKYDAARIEIASRTNRNLGLIGIGFGTMGVINILIQCYLLVRSP